MCKVKSDIELNSKSLKIFGDPFSWKIRRGKICLLNAINRFSIFLNWSFRNLMRWEISKKSKLWRIAIKNGIFQEKKNQDNQIFQLFIKNFRNLCWANFLLGFFLLLNFVPNSETKRWKCNQKTDNAHSVDWVSVNYTR